MEIYLVLSILLFVVAVSAAELFAINREYDRYEEIIKKRFAELERAVKEEI